MSTATIERAPASIAPPANWSAIRKVDCPLVVEPRTLPDTLTDTAAMLAGRAPFCIRADGPPDAVAENLDPVPDAIREDIAGLAHRFARLMRVETVRIRLEGVTTDACRKVHADYTDLRLITTYYGPGTQMLPGGENVTEADLWSIAPGDVGLFKGKLFAQDHAACLHRSPPLADSGGQRLVLVIDTPRFAWKPEEE